MRGARTIAEYAIRRWLQEQGFDMKYFKFILVNKEAILTDENDDSITLVYDNYTKEVYVKE